MARGFTYNTAVQKQTKTQKYKTKKTKKKQKKSKKMKRTNCSELFGFSWITSKRPDKLFYRIYSRRCSWKSYLQVVTKEAFE